MVPHMSASKYRRCDDPPYMEHNKLYGAADSRHHSDALLEKLIASPLSFLSFP
jgi:hypothetical protein